jgi:hypothetical protein
LTLTTFAEAKQAAFEEQNKIRNQFRALDDDEINFLDEVRERQRQEDEAKRRELEDGLKAFREARKAEGSTIPADEEGPVAEWGGDESWEVGGRKRKRVKGREREVKGVRRKVNDGEKMEAVGANAEAKPEPKVEQPKPEEPESTTPAKTTSGGGSNKALGLVAYGSDDSDDE